MNWQKYERIAFLFEPLERWSEWRSGFWKNRKTYITPLKGKILEIGAGTGANFPYYSDQAEVIAIEPSPQMLLRAKKQLEKSAKQNIRLEEGVAEKIKYEDNYFDVVVSSLVFCSVDNPEQAMKEMIRVLKPGGRAIFIEHMKSSHEFINRFLRFFNPIQKALVGCDLQRDTKRLISQSGLNIIKEENLKLKDVFRYFEAEKK